MPRTPCLYTKPVQTKNQVWFIPASIFLLIVKNIDSKQARANNSHLPRCYTDISC